MNGKSVLYAIVLISFGAGITYFLLSSQPQVSTNPPQVLPTAIPTIELSPTPQPIVIPPGWQTYTNTTYNFTISYPNSYKTLDDVNNLYGWKNGVVLLYKGGQSYDLIIQAWDSEADYQTQYPTNQSNLTVQKIGNFYLTLLNNNNDPEIDSIIATFKSR